MKIILTGVTGFLGSRLLADFIDRNYHVLILKRATTNMDMHFQRFGKLETWNIEGDELENIFYVHPDVNAIVHAATDYGRDATKPAATFWANEVFPIRLAELAMQYNISPFFNIDTFFNTNRQEYNYLGAYSLSKRHFQEWGRYFASTGRLGFVNLRLFHLYGPGDGFNKFVPSMVKRCLAGEELDLTDGVQKRDFIHVDDAVSAIGEILEAESCRKLGYCHYDVGTGKSIGIRDFMETVQRICNSGAKLNFGALQTRNGEFPDSRADIEALQKIGWRAKVGIEVGIQSVIQDIVRRESIDQERLGNK